MLTLDQEMPPFGERTGISFMREEVFILNQSLWFLGNGLSSTARETISTGFIQCQHIHIIPPCYIHISTGAPAWHYLVKQSPLQKPHPFE